MNFILVRATLPFAFLGLVMGCKLTKSKNPFAATSQFTSEKIRVVSNTEEVRDALKGRGIPMDSVFLPSQEAATLPATRLKAYLQAEIATEKSDHRKQALQTILNEEANYTWFVAGYTYKRKHFIFCLFTSIPRPEYKNTPYPKYFPSIQDGYTSVCEGLFSCSDQKFVKLNWNGSA